MNESHVASPLRPVRLLMLCATFAGCQCLEVVDDSPGDSGTGGGSAGADGGSTTGAGGTATTGGHGVGGGPSPSGGGTTTNDAGIAHPTDAGCAVASDCPGTEPSVAYCANQARPGWSCVDHLCLWECSGDRTCTTFLETDSGQSWMDCITCTGSNKVCNETPCVPFSRTATIESSTCGFLVSGQTSVVASDPTTDVGGCNFEITVGEITLGHFHQLADGSFFGYGTALGDDTCTGSTVPTNAERWVINCPLCQIQLRF